MNNLIDRQAAITLPVMPKEHREYQTYNLDDAYEQGWLDLQKCIEKLPSAQPEPRNKNNAEVISILSDMRSRYNCFDPEDEEYYRGLSEAIKALSAQPEIIRCGQCKYAEVADPEDSQDGYTCQFHRGSIWFSGSFCSWAERRTDDDRNG